MTRATPLDAWRERERERELAGDEDNTGRRRRRRRGRGRRRGGRGRGEDRGGARARRTARRDQDADYVEPEELPEAEAEEIVEESYDEDLGAWRRRRRQVRWSPPASLGRDLRLSAREGQRAAVLELGDGMWLVGVLPSRLVAQEGVEGIGSLLLATAAAAAKRKRGAAAAAPKERPLLKMLSRQAETEIVRQRAIQDDDDDDGEDDETSGLRPSWAGRDDWLSYCRCRRGRRGGR